MKTIKLTLTHYKLLDTIKWLNFKKLYPSQIGVYKVIHGTIDEDTFKITDCPTFSSITSYNGKKISRYLMILNRYGYIDKIYSEENKNYFLSINKNGLIALEEFHKKHRNPYKKAIKKCKREIVVIEK